MFVGVCNGSPDQQIEYDSTIGCLQGIIGRNLGSTFIIGVYFLIKR